VDQLLLVCPVPRSVQNLRLRWIERANLKLCDTKLQLSFNKCRAFGLLRQKKKQRDHNVSSIQGKGERQSGGTASKTLECQSGTSMSDRSGKGAPSRMSHESSMGLAVDLHMR
jgi:hypothetical protein